LIEAAAAIQRNSLACGQNPFLNLAHAFLDRLVHDSTHQQSLDKENLIGDMAEFLRRCCTSTFAFWARLEQLEQHLPEVHHEAASLKDPGPNSIPGLTAIRIVDQPRLAPKSDPFALAEAALEKLSRQKRQQVMLWAQEAREDIPAARVKLGRYLAAGRLGEESREQGWRILEAAAQNGVLGALLPVGKNFVSRYRPDSVKCRNGVRFLQEAARRGKIEAMRFLGSLYCHGKVIPSDYTKAIMWFRRAAHKGDVASQANLGLMILKGLGTRKQSLPAAFWLQKAARRGHPLAMRNLALLHAEGIGVTQDPKRAERLLIKAARRRNPEACLDLTALYLNQDFSGRSLDKARHWLKRAKATGGGRISPEKLAGLEQFLAHPQPVPPTRPRVQVFQPLLFSLLLTLLVFFLESLPLWAFLQPQ
jgi:TPR repeat protein